MENTKKVNAEVAEAPKKVATEVDKVVANCDFLNIRSKADKASSILGILKKDTIVKVDLSVPNNDFYKISVVVDNVKISGYCMKAFLADKNSK